MLQGFDLLSPDGYINMRAVFELPAAFIWIIGGRGTGKTYGSIKYLLEERKRFILLRRTATQAQLVQTPSMSPIKSVVNDTGLPFVAGGVTKGIGGVYEYRETEDGKQELINPPLGYVAALSTFANVRGFDASDVEFIFYDEFIKEQHEKGIPSEADALLNAYETVNRNRELYNRPPVKLVATSNSTDLANPIFTRLGLVLEFEKMRKKGYQLRFLADRSTILIDLQNNPISESKRTTALYRMAHGTDFARMALDNDYNINLDRYQSLSLREYKPLVCIGELCIYKHKSRTEYYCTPHYSGSPRVYGVTAMELKRFKRWESWVALAYINGSIQFESYYCEALLCEYLKMSR